jgi:hypothetical protein
MEFTSSHSSNSLTPGEDWGPKTRGALVAAVTNRQWPQARLVQAMLVKSDNCRLHVAMGLCDPEDSDPQAQGHDSPQTMDLSCTAFL